MSTAVTITTLVISAITSIMTLMLHLRVKSDCGGCVVETEPDASTTVSHTSTTPAITLTSTT